MHVAVCVASDRPTCCCQSKASTPGLSCFHRSHAVSAVPVCPIVWDSAATPCAVSVKALTEQHANKWMMSSITFGFELFTADGDQKVFSFYLMCVLNSAEKIEPLWISLTKYHVTILQWWKMIKANIRIGCESLTLPKCQFLRFKYCLWWLIWSFHLLMKCT